MSAYRCHLQGEHPFPNQSLFPQPREKTPEWIFLGLRKRKVGRVGGEKALYLNSETKKPKIKGTPHLNHPLCETSIREASNSSKRKPRDRNHTGYDGLREGFNGANSPEFNS